MQTANNVRHALITSLRHSAQTQFEFGLMDKAIDRYEHGLIVARQIGDHVSEGKILAEVGRCYAAADQVERAIEAAQQALSIAEALTEPEQQVKRLVALSALHHKAGRINKAFEIADHAREIAHKYGLQRAEHMAHEQRAAVHEPCGELQQAFEHSQVALELAYAADDQVAALRLLDRLQRLAAALNLTDAALQYHEQATAMAESQQSGSSIMLDIAEAYAQRGEVDRAAALYQQMAERARAAGNAASELTVLSALGMLYAMDGDPEHAMQSYERALALHPDDQVLRLQLLRGLGSAAAALGNWDRALNAFQRAVTAAHEAGDRRAEAASLAAVGETYVELMQSQRAAQAFAQAAAITQSLGDQVETGHLLEALAGTYVGQAKIPSAVDTYEKAVAYAKRTGDRRSEAIRLVRLAHATGAMGGVSSALTLAKDARVIFKEIGDAALLAWCQEQIVALGGR